MSLNKPILRGVTNKKTHSTVYFLFPYSTLRLKQCGENHRCRCWCRRRWFQLFGSGFCPSVAPWGRQWMLPLRVRQRASSRKTGAALLLSTDRHWRGRFHPQTGGRRKRYRVQLLALAGCASDAEYRRAFEQELQGAKLVASSMGQRTFDVGQTI